MDTNGFDFNQLRPKNHGQTSPFVFLVLFFTWPKKAASRFELAADEKGEIDAICRTVFSHGFFSQKCLWFCCMGRIGEPFQNDMYSTLRICGVGEM